MLETFVLGWVLSGSVCAEAKDFPRACFVMTPKNLGSQYYCERAAESLGETLTNSTPVELGLPADATVQFMLSCAARRGSSL